MTSSELENLARIGKLKREPPSAREFAGLLRSGEMRLTDATKTALALESRFDLAYNAAHALALAGLRRLGYRSENRYLVFQVLPHTLGLPPATGRVLATCHERRNRAEYAGVLDVDDLFYGTPTPGNVKAEERYAENRFSVTRQLRYSRDETQLALDLALFTNGLPVATSRRASGSPGDCV